MEAAVASLLLLLAQAPADAADPAAERARLVALMADAEYGRHGFGAVFREVMRLRMGCDEIDPMHVAITEVIAPPRFGPRWPMAGSWMEKHEVSACGVRMHVNLRATAQPGRLPRLEPTVPGQTRAPLALQQAVAADLQRQAATAGCPRPTLLYTRLATTPSAPAPSAPAAWEELWTYERCGPRATWTVAFDGQGGYAARMTESYP